MSDGNASLTPDIVTLIRAFRTLQPAIVALDGPAGSGKSTVGYRLAQEVDFLFFDTGVMYRAITWAALEQALNIYDEVTISELAQQIQIQVTSPEPQDREHRQNSVFVDGYNVTHFIRTPTVEKHVSIVSAYPVVRHALSDQQRRIGQYYGTGQAEKAGVVMAGRDIGTVVMPEAPLKIYLDASTQERARRRYTELVTQGKTVEFAAILEGIFQRDQLDSQRAVSPLHPAEDAIIIDTSALSPDAVVMEILRLADRIMHTAVRQ